MPYIDLHNLVEEHKKTAKQNSNHDLSLKAEVLSNILTINEPKTSLGLYDLLRTRHNKHKPPLGERLSLDSYPDDVQTYAQWARIDSVRKGPLPWQKIFKPQLWKDAFGELSGYQKRALAPILLEYGGTLYCQVDFFKILVEVAKNISMKPSEAIQQALEDVSNQLAAPPSHKEPTDDREAPKILKTAAILETMVYGKENTL